MIVVVQTIKEHIQYKLFPHLETRLAAVKGVYLKDRHLFLKINGRYLQTLIHDCLFFVICCFLLVPFEEHEMTFLEESRRVVAKGAYLRGQIRFVDVQEVILDRVHHFPPLMEESSQSFGTLIVVNLAITPPNLMQFPRQIQHHRCTRQIRSDRLLQPLRQ